MMKRLIALTLTLFPIIAIFLYQGVDNTRLPAQTGLKHVVFDLDGTLVESLGHGVSGDVILDSGEAYHVLPHARALVERAWREGLQIHFFSGGPKERNLDLLSKLTLADGRRFDQLAASIHSFEDLTDLGEDVVGERFTDRYRKDLTKIGKIEELIIFEDNVTFPLDEPQRARAVALPIHEGGALNSWRRDQRLAWGYQAFEEILDGKNPSDVNNKDIHERMIKGMRKLGVEIKPELSRHGCAGMFYSLGF